MGYPVTRLLVLVALPLSLIVPGGAVAIAAFSTSSEQETIELPVGPEPTSPTPESPSATPSPTPEPEPETEIFKLFGGRSIRVDPVCADQRRLDEQKSQAIAAANRIPALRQRLLNTKRDARAAERPFQRFLDQHPEQSLAPDDFATYTSLKAEYEAHRRLYRTALQAHNRQVDVFNGLADAYNADLHACEA